MHGGDERTEAVKENSQVLTEAPGLFVCHGGKLKEEGIGRGAE